jgi:tetratricopeptide (TPR) repeat protein
MGFTSGIGVLFLALAVCKLAASQATTNAIESVSSALQAGHYSQALEILRPQLQRNPKNAQLLALNGIALSGEGNKKDALRSFQEALQILPEYLPALEGAAQIEYENGDRGAEALLQRILKLHPDDATSHAMLAVLAYRQHDCGATVYHFAEAGVLVSSQPDALEEYGDCLLRLGENEKAISVFGQALEMSTDATARYGLAIAQLETHRSKDAIATLQPILQANHADADALDLESSAYEAEGNVPEAVRILREAIVSNPHNIDLYVDFARICLDHQSFQVGVDMINAGLSFEAKSAALFLARGVLYVQLAEYELGEADFEKADALNPRQSMSSAAEGLAAVEENDPARALAAVRSKLARKPNDSFLLYLQAGILAESSPKPGSAEFREAVRSARKAASLDASLAAAHDILAKLYLQSGQTDGSIQESRKALNIDPKDQTALYHLIQALRKSGQNDAIPTLLKQLADLREASAQEEADRNRYKLVEEKIPSESAHP